MKKILIILFTLLNFSNSHHFGEQITIDDADANDWNDKVTNIFSQSKEMATCTCDLTSHCDIYCCCDEKCSEDLRKEWTEKSLCLNNNKKWVEDYKCKNGEETFKYNKEKAGINIKDHIFNIMCIKYDRSSDMVNYYLQYDEEADKTKIDALKQEWINKFFPSEERRLQEKAYKYGENIDKTMTLYKADSNGKCISSSTFFLIPFESSCYLESDLTSIDETDINIQSYGITTGTDRKISEITYIIYYTSSNGIEKIEAKVLYISKDSKSKQIKFKVQWKINETPKQTKNFPPGYLQGNPIKINDYNNGYYFHIYNYDGECIDNKDNSFNPVSILFKNNMFISCKYNKANSDDDKKYLIYEMYNDIITENLKFYSAPNATDTDYIKIIDKTDTNFETDLNDRIYNKNQIINIKINLIFLTTQRGKENSPYDIIQKVYIKKDLEEIAGTDQKISLIVNFVDFSFPQIENSKNNITTNSIPLPKELIERMSE